MITSFIATYPTSRIMSQEDFWVVYWCELDVATAIRAA